MAINTVKHMIKRKLNNSKKLAFIKMQTNKSFKVKNNSVFMLNTLINGFLIK